MSNDTVRTLSVGQGVEIQDACRRQGVTLAELKMLTSGDNLRRSIDFLNGISSAAGAFDSVNFIGKGWSIVGERKKLPEGWSPKQLVGISALKSAEDYIDGHEWKKRLVDKPLLGVEAFWLCWNNLDQIHEELKSKVIFFDGDVLRDSDGNRCSLCLSWYGKRWDWDCGWLGDDRSDRCVSAVVAS
jgi:hypothetical protein